jgi:hypothetical protein
MLSTPRTNGAPATFAGVRARRAALRIHAASLANPANVTGHSTRFAAMLRIALLCCLAAFAAGCAEVVVPERPARTPARSCVSPQGVANISFSKTKYPNIRRHYETAVAQGWPRVLVLNRSGSDTRRSRLLRRFATRHGMDRDEYPPAVARGSYSADVAYVPSSENRSHGARMGIKLRRFCDGTRFRYVFY